MEFAKGHLIITLGCANLSRTQFISDAIGIVPAKDCHMASDCIGDRVTDSNGCDFHTGK